MNELVYVAIGVLALFLLFAIMRARRSSRRVKRGPSISDMEKRQAFFRSVSEKGHDGAGDGS